MLDSTLEFMAFSRWPEEARTVLTLTALLIAALIARRILLRVLTGFFDTLAKRLPSVEERRRVETLGRVFRHTISVVLLVMIGMMALNTLGIPIAPILGAAGVAGVAIGFGAQSLVKDFFTGVFLLLEDQIRVGDVVEIAGKTGVVENLTLRRTKLRSYDGGVHYVPNGLITTVTNHSTEFAFAVIEVAVFYRENIERLFAMMRDVAAELRADASFAGAITDDLEISGIENWSDLSMTVRCRIKVRPLEQWRVRREFLKRLNLAFHRAGVEVPSHFKVGADAAASSQEVRNRVSGTAP
ncbi:MAG: hypothetical protein RLZZ153_2600 [Pseudomonadota bacterium]|jgi:small-conductance mechanosensitive channel